MSNESCRRFTFPVSRKRRSASSIPSQSSRRAAELFPSERWLGRNDTRPSSRGSAVGFRPIRTERDHVSAAGARLVNKTIHDCRFGTAFAALLMLAFALGGCVEDETDIDEPETAVQFSRPIHQFDDGQCALGSHMCCDMVGQFQCLTDSPVGDNLCPPGFDEPCDGDGPPPSECGPGNHACCDLSGQVQCLTDAPPGQLNLCPPGFDHC